MGNQINVDPNELLRTRVTGYIPNAFHQYGEWSRNRPIFTQMMIREMIKDPRVKFGLWLIKGPILSKARCIVECENEDVRQYAITLINKFWANGAVQALKAVEWGYSGSEVLYTKDDEGRIVYKGLKDFDSPAVRVVAKDGDRTGIVVNTMMYSAKGAGKEYYLGGPKCFHHVHGRHMHPFYGESRLHGAHIPWNENWCEGGYRDIRRMWFYKNAFEGGTMYHPEGAVQLPSGQIVQFQDIAQGIIEKKRAGATLTLPSTMKDGQRVWEHVPPKGNTIPSGLFDYEQSLRIEIIEAMGIPYEVIESSGNEGFGSSTGREIPETAFYSILQEELTWLIHDFVEQIVKPMIAINSYLGLLPQASVEVNTFPLEASSVMLENDLLNDDAELSGEKEDMEQNPPTGVEGDGAKQPRAEPPKSPEQESGDKAKRRSQFIKVAS